MGRPVSVPDPVRVPMAGLPAHGGSKETVAALHRHSVAETLVSVV